MLAVIGYSNFGTKIGQVNITSNPDCPGWVGVKCLARHFALHNKLSSIPIINIYTGISKIAEGILSSYPDKDQWNSSYVIEEDYTKYRVILVLTGLVELTLVGGWLLHGGMTIYYYSHTNGDA